MGYNRGMKTTRQLTAIIEREDDSYVASCPELDIASQGDSVESARRNLIEALELFFESADASEITRRVARRSIRHAGRGCDWVNAGSSLASKSAEF